MSCRRLETTDTQDISNTVTVAVSETNFRGRLIAGGELL